MSRGIVKAIDFSWSGATSLSGEKLSFVDGMNAFQVGNQTAKILETIPLGNHTRVYLIDQLISQ
ncbi:MAG: hypothetical protein IPO72_08855 [Saprospiraceae bacterium]|nr:hypothetical protein [Candidatus Vicinibacter affinis]